MGDEPPVPFSALPLNKENEAAQLNAWGAYGLDDELGFLNRQTEALIAAAALEIKRGIRVPLDKTVNFQGPQNMFERATFKHHVWQKKPRIVHDDEWHFNTQGSTQWDGFRHYGYQGAARFYNNTTVEDIAGSTPKAESNPHILGIQNFANRGGIMGRGVFIDFARWADGPGKDMVMAETDGTGFQPLSRSAIKLSWLKATLDWQKTTIKYGDILIIRSGFMRAYHAAQQDVLDNLYRTKPHHVGGVEATTEMLEWIWTNFSAVAGDQPAFEQVPFDTSISAHEVLLAGWGCPIGELFDLERLSEVCEREERWTFFFSSQVVNVPGGVASPPNAVAIL